MAEADEDTLPEAELDALGEAERLAEPADPAGLLRSYSSAMLHALLQPWRSGPVLTRYSASMAAVGATTAAQLMGADVEPIVAPDPKDWRFTDEAWQCHPFFRGLGQAYLVTARMLEELVDAADLDEPASSKARFTARLIGDAIAPTNSFVTNPVALRRAAETRGASAVQGARNFLRDVRENDGWPRRVDPEEFRVGTHLAATPGTVVYRNELMELLQYTPQTDDVYEIPLLAIPPWINRYYILDLAPGKSLVEWTVRHGHTTFSISYRNPGPSTPNWSFDDYLRLGPLAAIDAVQEITGAEQVNTVAACLGGVLNAASLAHLDAEGRNPVNSSTYLVSALDYTDGGVLRSVFTDRGAVELMAKRMEAQGYLEAKQMAHTFDLLRANDLVFRYVVDGWFLGEQPKAFDLLAWNEDSTRIPGRAHAEFMRAILDNAIANDRFSALGHRLRISDITTDSYVLAAIDDHIVPWRSSYQNTQLFKGPVRFVLSSSGHIAGIVNPPSPKARHWTGDELPVEADKWFALATPRTESWWNDWAEWLGARAGERVAPPAPEQHSRSLGDAPGTYVLS